MEPDTVLVRRPGGKLQFSILVHLGQGGIGRDELKSSKEAKTRR